MKTIIGIVSTKSYHMIDQCGRYIIIFSMQIDHKNYIYGDVLVKYITTYLQFFNPGDRVTIDDKISVNNGFHIKTTKVSKISVFR